MQGRIRFYNTARGFGFVECEAGSWFFHKREVIGEVTLWDTVEFWLEDSAYPEKPLEAVQVKRWEI